MTSKKNRIKEWLTKPELKDAFDEYMQWSDELEDKEKELFDD